MMRYEHESISQDTPGGISKDFHSSHTPAPLRPRRLPTHMKVPMEKPEGATPQAGTALSDEYKRMCYLGDSMPFPQVNQTANYTSTGKALNKTELFAVYSFSTVVQHIKPRFVGYNVDTLAEAKAKWKDTVKTFIYLCHCQCTNLPKGDDGKDDVAWALTRLAIQQASIIWAWFGSDFGPNGGYQQWRTNGASMQCCYFLKGFRIPIIA